MKSLPGHLAVRLARGARAALTAAGALLLAVSLTPLVHWWGRALAVDWGSGRGEVLVVLAGAALGDGILGENSYWRSVFAVQDFRAHSYRRVIISGASDGARPVAVAMKQFLIAHDVPADRIEVDTASQSTRENALFTAALLKQETGPVVLVTSDYHMRRAAAQFARAGISVIPHPYPDVEKRYGHPARRWSAAIDLAVESAKLAYYRWKGWI